ncbi:MAG: hypothetical protein JST31_12905 [Actinobacteria bacterium]|nr:hypothetical protein [Actinomycetota bacterium]
MLPTALEDLRRAPWTLWAYLALVVVSVPVGLATVSGKVYWQPLVFFALVGPVLLFFLLRGNRFVWWLLVLSGTGGVVISIITGEPWYRFLGGLIGLGLLLAPPSRGYVFRPKLPPPQDAAASDPSVHSDPAQPPGWYIDPSDATRMRYWNSELGGWQAQTTRARRSILAPGRERPAPTRPAQETWDPDDHDDDARPPGWYYDRADPTRMRYWDAQLGGWQPRTTRAPRRRGGRPADG